MENAKKVDIPTKIRHYFLFSNQQLRSNIPDQGRERLRRSLVAFLITLVMLKRNIQHNNYGACGNRAPYD